MTPNNGGTLKADTGSIGASTEFTWELAGGGAGTWRVIPEDARWPTDDAIVAICEVTDAEYNLPANPTNTDCTAAFQAAVDACAAAGGGTVFVPEGQYRLDGPLSVGNNVFLRGRWRELHAGDSGANLGTVIRCEKYHCPMP
ncbi:MAG: hypothetical protein HC901_02255 [Bdellovibrionaceae bacterium]|nr:hypothetical protein [Pseudobdellovibrionaceae bacterium]